MMMQNEKLERHPDLKAEYEEWERTGKIPENEIKVEGYTAREIMEMAPFLKGKGAYNFLVDLRERPEVAKKYIEEGFPVA